MNMTNDREEILMMVKFQIRKGLTSEGSVNRVTLIVFPETAMRLDSQPLFGLIPNTLLCKFWSVEIAYLNTSD